MEPKKGCSREVPCAVHQGREEDGIERKDLLDQGLPAAEDCADDNFEEARGASIGSTPEMWFGQGVKESVAESALVVMIRRSAKKSNLLYHRDMKIMKSIIIFYSAMH